MTTEIRYPKVDVDEGKRLLVDQAGGEPRTRRSGSAMCAAPSAACFARVNNAVRSCPPLIVFGPLQRRHAEVSGRFAGDWHEGYWHHA